MTVIECARTEVTSRVAVARNALDALLTMSEVAADRPLPSLRALVRDTCDAVERTAMAELARER